MTPGPLRHARGAALALTLGACAPKGDRGDLCADVGASRVCWTAGEGQSPELVSRSVVPRPAPPAGPFVCNDRRCVQAHPRLPDDGEWECVDLDGVVVCRGGAPPAGVVAGPPDPGFRCGPRRSAADAGPGERICVDLSPDLPHGAARGWECSFDRGQSGARACVEKEGAPAIGGSGPCPRGAVRVEGLCLPPRPHPECWVDPDCGPQRACLFGTCGSGG